MCPSPILYVEIITFKVTGTKKWGLRAVIQVMRADPEWISILIK